jgi:hypothetical protein
MKKMRLAAAFVPILLILALHLPRAEAGRPMPYEYPAVFREANMVMLKFQEALAAERWAKALAFCSEPVQRAAGQFPSPRAFLATTLPLREILAGHRLGYWSEQHNGDQHRYRMLIQLTPDDQKPLVQWYWSMSTEGKGWLIDWEPVAVDLQALIAKENAAIADRQRRVDAARRELAPKLRVVKTHLTALSERFVLGSPMLFRDEFMNFGEAPVRYTAAGVGYEPLVVVNAGGDAIPCLKGPAQLMLDRGELAPGATAVLADRIDLNRDFAFARAGTYHVQFDGKSLKVGEWIESNRLEGLPDQEFIATEMTFPSNVLKIEVAESAEWKEG